MIGKSPFQISHDAAMIFTTFLKQNKTLVSCRQGGLEDARANSGTCGNSRLYLMNFRDFNDSTVKNKVLDKIHFDSFNINFVLICSENFKIIFN